MTISSLLNGCTIALSGGFGQTHTEIAEELSKFGAKYSKAVSKTTTHLITTQADYDKVTTKVKNAFSNNIPIVSLDWFEKIRTTSAATPVDDFVFGGPQNNSSQQQQKAKTESKSNSKKRDTPILSDNDEDDVKKVKNDIKPIKKAKNEPATTLEDKVQKESKPQQIARSCNLSIAPDEYFQKSGYKVYIDPTNNVIYDAALNQTNAGGNNNKFYFIQLLTSTTGSFTTFTRWGRVGERGQNQELASSRNVEDARRAFCKKFRDKTGLAWENRGDSPKAGKYVYLERSYGQSDDTDDEGIDGYDDEDGDNNDVVSKLDPSIQDLMALIFNDTFVQDNLKQLEYDVDRLPLGNLSKTTLKRGYEALKNIEQLIQSGQFHNSQIEQYSNQYYSYIPHSFGRSRPPIINSISRLQRETTLLDNLLDIKDSDLIKKASTTKIKEEKGLNIHPMDQRFECLQLDEMESLDPNTNEYKELHKYLFETRGKTHTANYKVEQIFRIERKGEKDRFFTYNDNAHSSRKLLWHGSRCSNFGGILSQGLRIAPPEAPVSGYMFGKGIYLADMSSKSANYCCSYISDNTALLLLCEAELGNPMLELLHADYNAGENAKKQNRVATWGKGKTCPQKWKDAGCIHEDLKGVEMPDLTAKPTDTIGYQSLQYNEYICYNESQVKLRYLFRVKM